MLKIGLQKKILLQVNKCVLGTHLRHVLNTFKVINIMFRLWSSQYLWTIKFQLMKTLKQSLKPAKFISLFLIFLLGFSFGNAQVTDNDKTDPNKPETELQPELLWDVKAYLPAAKLIKIKAIDKDGNIYDVKAIQSFDDTSMLDIKALVNGERLPIKLIVKDTDVYYPLKAITKDGTLLDIKGITESGEILPVKGVGRSGTIVHIRAIGKSSSFYTLFAISPEGQVNDVKGIKMLNTTVETTIKGVSIFAHVKALRQN